MRTFKLVCLALLMCLLTIACAPSTSEGEIYLSSDSTWFQSAETECRQLWFQAKGLNPKCFKEAGIDGIILFHQDMSKGFYDPFFNYISMIYRTNNGRVTSYNLPVVSGKAKLPVFQATLSDFQEWRKQVNKLPGFKIATLQTLNPYLSGGMKAYFLEGKYDAGAWVALHPNNVPQGTSSDGCLLLERKDWSRLEKTLKALSRKVIFVVKRS